jgi:hypothetical protein
MGKSYHTAHLSTCFISETVKQIRVKFGIVDCIKVVGRIKMLFRWIQYLYNFLNLGSPYKYKIFVLVSAVRVLKIGRA